jgi:hypothetical protein
VVNKNTNSFIDKYPPGTALLQLPFFLAADWIAIFSGFARTGVSLPYQIASAVSGIFYLLLGTIFLSRILREYFKDHVATLTVWLMVAGTNVFHWGTYDAAGSHIYSFALIAIYTWLILRYARMPGPGFASAAGIALGLITITRNQNIIVGLIALGLWLEAARQHNKVQHSLQDAALFVLSLLLTLIPMLAYWKFATGHWIIYSYESESGFNWHDPKIIDFLFSVRKGLFFWSPALFVVLPGFFLLPRHLRVFGTWSGLTMAIHVYICASWHEWWFGGGFGSRPFVDMMPILCLPAAAALSQAMAWWNVKVVRSIVGALIILNILMMNSYWLGLIPFDGTNLETLRSLPARYYQLLEKVFAGGIHDLRRPTAYG